MKPLEDQSFYELLDVPSDVTQPALERAFEQAMQFYGPESMAVYSLVDPEESTRLIQRLEEAYLTLSDPTLRREYDARMGIVSASLQAAAALAEPAAPAQPVAPPAPSAPEPPAPSPVATPPSPAVPPVDSGPASQLELRPILKAARIYPWPATAHSAEEPPSPRGPEKQAPEASASAKLTALLGAIPPAEGAEPPPAAPPTAEQASGVVLASQALQGAGEGSAAENPPVPAPPAPVDEPPLATAMAAAREVPVVRPSRSRTAAPVHAVRPAEPPPGLKAEPAAKSPAPAHAAPPSPGGSEAAAPVGAPEGPKAPAAEQRTAPAEEPRAAAPAGTTAKPAPKPLEIPADGVFNGELLRRVREGRGLALRDLADKTRIGSMHLENIEADRYEHLPATVYLRGFLMTYARELKLDPLKVSKSYLDLVAAARAGAARPGLKG